MANEEDYFIAANSVGAINEEQYKKLDVLIHTTVYEISPFSIPICI